METTTQNIIDFVNSVAAGTVPASEIAANRSLKFAIKKFSFHAAGVTATPEMKTAMQSIRAEIIKLETPPKSVMVKCSCGCTVPSESVMSANLGTSCPTCYDRMSD